MRIKWSPVAVMNTADELEDQVEKIIKPLEKAKMASKKALEIPNLPGYVKYRFNAFIFEIEKIIGGAELTGHTMENGLYRSYTYTNDGTLKSKIADIRKEVPDDALKEARTQPELLKRGAK